MTLPAPNLDDRRFQDLVDEAKRLVQQRCPRWTDHNVSDPGVTLIEAFAWMVDQMLYRFNRVPDRNYVKFLELLGVRLFPPTPARTDVTFWLSAPQPEIVRIPTGTEAATQRNADGGTVTFTTIEDLAVVPCELSSIASSITPGDVRDHTDGLEAGAEFFCFDQVPKPDDSLFIGLSDPVPSCAVALRFDCTIEGVGVDPHNPPLRWEAWDGKGWAACEVDKDETGGLNRAGDVIVHLPRSHTASVIGAQRAGWIRCVVTETQEDQPPYSASPKISKVTAFSIGGTAAAMHAEVVREEIIGSSDGTPGQRFSLNRTPVVDNGPRTLEVAGEGGWQEWHEVAYFTESGPEDPHFSIDSISGEVALGPAVRLPNGVMRYFGAVPSKGAKLRMSAYATGGGVRGNVEAGALRSLKSSLPYVSRVENRHPARGGVDGEDLDNAKIRGPLLLRAGDRAVTVDDYEQLAREAAPEVARVRCVEADTGAGPGSVRVLVVPAVGGGNGRLRFEDLVPSEESLEKIARHLDERRMIGARVHIQPPQYQGVTAVAVLRARQQADPERLQRSAREALNNYFHPVTGGPDGRGWPFGRHILAGEVYSVLQSVRGVEYVEKVDLFAADPTTGKRGSPVERIDLQPHALVFSYEHQVRVEEGP